MLFISSIELYYIYEAIPVMQELYPDENQYLKIVTSFLVTVASAVGAHFARVVFEYLFTPFFLKRAKMQNDVELRKTYGDKATDNAFKLLYHAGMVAYGYYVIIDTVCHHVWIGGTQTD